MKRLLLSFNCIVTVFLLLSACDRPDPEVPEEPVVPEYEFLLDVSDVTSTSCRFSVTPADETMTYVVMLVDKASYDEYENEFKYQDSDLEWFERKAMEEGLTLEDWLAGFLKKGKFEGEESGLMPGENYYLYAYGLDYQGYFTTGVTKVEFSTPEIPMTDVSFTIEVKDIGLTSAKVDVTPSDDKARYFVNVFSMEEYQQWGGNDDAFAAQAAALVDYYIMMGKTLKEIVANLGSIGHTAIPFDDLTDNTEYIAYAIGIDDNFFVNSLPSVVRFKTSEVKVSDNTFAIDITGTTFCSVSGTVTPSNDDPFVCAIQPKAQVDLYESETDLMYEVVSTYDKWDALDEILYVGETVDLEAISSLEPSMDYVVLCFGWEGAPTTPLFKAEFTTDKAGGRPQQQELKFSFTDIQHNKFTVHITPKVGLHYFYECISVGELELRVAAAGTRDEAICTFLDEKIDYGAEFFGCTRAEYLADMGAAIGKDTWTFTGLEEDTEYVVVAASVNMNTGRLALRKGFCSEAVRTGVLIESDAEIAFSIDKYYDGSELAALDPVQFGKCEGMVLVPYQVIPNGTAAHWRTTFAYGEFRSWAERDDVLLELDYKCDEDKTQGYAVVHYDQIVSFLGIAVNDEGYTGPFTIYEFKAERGGASPAREFMDQIITNNQTHTL
ncbi:MAG: hypothetical protein IJE85_00365 [Bacteroidales bacterium]|nr:hypothetical protein [Bacteroidales bacterium]